MAVTLPDWRVIAGGFDGGAGSGTGKPFEEVPIGPKDGVNRVFRLTYTPAWGFLQLFVNGDQQSKFVPRFSLAGNIVTFAIAPWPTDELYCWYFRGPASTAALRAREFARSRTTDAVNWGPGSLFRLIASMSAGVWCMLPSNARGTILFRGFDSSTTEAQNDAFKLGVTSSSTPFSLNYSHDYGAAGGFEDHDFAAAIPVDTWRYVGFSRDDTAKTVSLYVGNGVIGSFIEAWAYTHSPTGGTDPACQMLVGTNGFDIGGQWFSGPLEGTLEEHYIWSRSITAAEHLLASQGNPPTSGLLLACAMGTSPEIDNSGNGGSGTVTGTELVEGH